MAAGIKDIAQKAGVSSVGVSKTRIGKTAVQLLSDRIASGNNASITKVVISGKLTRRDSVRNLK